MQHKKNIKLGSKQNFHLKYRIFQEYVVHLHYKVQPSDLANPRYLVKHANTLCGQNIGFRMGGTYPEHCAYKGRNNTNAEGAPDHR